MKDYSRLYLSEYSELGQLFHARNSKAFNYSDLEIVRIEGYIIEKCVKRYSEHLYLWIMIYIEHFLHYFNNKYRAYDKRAIKKLNFEKEKRIFRDDNLSIGNLNKALSNFNPNEEIKIIFKLYINAMKSYLNIKKLIFKIFFKK